MVDTLQKYESRLDLDTEQGRDFVMFRRELFKMYEVQHRSLSDHDAFSFTVERENLYYLAKANQSFLGEMRRLNDIEDLRSHSNLKGAYFRRHSMATSRFTGLGYFGIAGLTYAYFPIAMGLLGKTGAMLAIYGSSFMGMLATREHNVVNSIALIKDGENQGKLRINVATSLISSRDIIAEVSNTQALFSLLDNQGDIENNVIEITNYTDSSGQTQQVGHFVLPSEAWKDFNMVDFVTSRKEVASMGDTTQQLFEDLMQERFENKQAQ